MSTIKHILSGKCPKCKEGAIFAKPGNIFLLKEPKMNTCCSSCGYRFEKEPGYFIGSLYISYGLTVLEMLSLFLISYYFLPIYTILIEILIALILMSLINFRYARIFWIWLFPY